MKKLSIALSIILSGYSTCSFTYCFPRCVSIPRLHGGPIFGVTGLYWKASALQNDFTFDSPIVSTTSNDFSNGKYHEVDLDYNWGFQAYLGYMFPCTANDVLLTYTYYDNDDRHNGFGDGLFSPSLSVPAIISVPVPTITVSVSDFIATFTGEALDLIVDNFQVESAKVDYNQQIWDLDFGQHLCIGTRSSWRFYAGIRYSHLERKFNETLHGSAAGIDSLTAPISLLPGALSTLDFSLSTDVTEHISEKTRYNGVGPRFGIDLNYCLGGGFSLVGGGAVATLIGESRSNFNNTSIADSTLTLTAVDFPLPDFVVTGITLGVPVSSTSLTTVSYHETSDTRIVPNIDAKIGLAFNYNFRNCGQSSLGVEAGYRVNHYFNAINILSEADAITPENHSRQTNDVSFYGPYIGITVAI